MGKTFIPQVQSNPSFRRHHYLKFPMRNGISRMGRDAMYRVRLNFLIVERYLNDFSCELLRL